MRSIPARTDVLRVRGLSVGIEAGSATLEIVRHIDLAVAPGQCVALVGESGAGKSLALRAILGLAGRRARIGGCLELDGREYPLAEPATLQPLLGATLGMVFQDAGGSLTPHLTLRRQLGGVLETHRGLTGAAREAESVRLLEAVRIPDVRTRLAQYPHELSGGLRQRVALALALAPRPRYLFADEPTTALDATLQVEILALLRELGSEAGLGVLLVSHDFGVVTSLAHRLLVMYAGRVVEDGEAVGMLAAPAHPYTAALLAARPRIDDSPLAGLATLPGQPPEPGRWPAGCAFEPRCRHRRTICREAEPALAPQDGGSRVACHAPLAGPAT